MTHLRHAAGCRVANAGATTLLAFAATQSPRRQAPASSAERRGQGLGCLRIDDHRSPQAELPFARNELVTGHRRLRSGTSRSAARSELRAISNVYPSNWNMLSATQSATPLLGPDTAGIPPAGIRAGRTRSRG